LADEYNFRVFIGEKEFEVSEVAVEDSGIISFFDFNITPPSPTFDFSMLKDFRLSSGTGVINATNLGLGLPGFGSLGLGLGMSELQKNAIAESQSGSILNDVKSENGQTNWNRYRPREHMGVDMSRDVGGAGRELGYKQEIPVSQDNDAKKAQYYLAKIGFNIGKDGSGTPIIDGDLGVMSSSSLILFQYKTGLSITGKTDAATLDALADYNQKALTFNDIMKMPDREIPLRPVGENGQLDINTLTRIPAMGGQEGNLYQTAAVAWARMVQAAAQEGLDVSAFRINGPRSGYRSLQQQKEMVVEKGGQSAIEEGWVAVPGTSNHGLGLAADLYVASGDKEWEWLHKNGARFGFRPYLREDWHWDYKP